MFHLGKSNKQEGSAPLIVIISLMSVAIMILGMLNMRMTNELGAVSHERIVVDKLAVRSALVWNLNCSQKLVTDCPLNTQIDLSNKDGETFIDSSGKSKIGLLNVKAECIKKQRAEYWIMTSRQDDAGNFLLDPLTRKKMEWTPLFPLSEICSKPNNVGDKMLANVCYGTVDGRFDLPKSLIGTCRNCFYRNKFCGEDQISFPSCPQDYKAINRYVDRFGWGGIDLAKYTVCRKNEEN